MLKLLIIFLLYSTLTFSQHSKDEVLSYQKELNDFYLNSETSPLKREELMEFKGLNFFPYNEKMLVAATLERLENQPEFKMPTRSEEHTSELQSRPHLVCRLLLEKKKKKKKKNNK